MEPGFEEQLNKIGENVDPATDADQFSLDEHLQQEKYYSLRQDRSERKDYARRLFSMMACWLFGVFLILFWQGFGSKIGFFSLDSKVLVTLLAGTTANVLGLFLLVNRYLFSEKRITDENGAK